MAAAVIEAEDVGRQFAGVSALRAVQLRVCRAEAVAVFGPNGAGKTTLLRVLATLLRPSTGTVRLFGETLRDGGAQARRRIGFLSHQSFLYPDLTATENLEFYARMFRLPAGTQRVGALLERVGLTGWAHRPVRTLSRGLEQRCALARTLLHQPQLLLLDEPFSGLDVAAATALSAILREAHAAGTTLLMTTHDIARGVELCGRAVILRRGRLVWDGPIDNTHPEAFERQYLAALQPAEPAVP